MAGGKGGKYMKSWQTVLKKSGIAALAAALALIIRGRKKNWRQTP